MTSTKAGDAVRHAQQQVSALRAELGRAATDDQRVWSVDGATFRFDVVTSDPIPPGGHVELTLPDGARLVGQITSVAPSERPGPSIVLDDSWLGAGVAAEVRVPIRCVTGAGSVLGELVDGGVVPPERRTFDDATLVTAADGTVAALLDGRDGGLRFGTLLGSDVPVELSAAGLGRHTFVCGQSGSGKTYSIGKLVEQVLLRTSLPVVALDPNSDYVTLTTPREVGDTGLDPAEYDRQCAQLADLAPQVPVFGGDRDRLAVRFGRLTPAEQAMVLALDPVADSRAYGVLRRAAEQAGPDATLDDVLSAARGAEGGDALDERARNLGVDRWQVWAGEGERTVGDRLTSPWRAAVFDLGAAASAAERSVVAAAVLGALWADRYSRRPRLVLIDEAHNVCPTSPSTAAEGAAADVVRAIAAEGRKFGLYLLLATQEPHKVHPDVLSQCSNLLLMRTTSTAALERLTTAFADVPPDVLALAPTLRRGEGIVAGPVAPHPVLVATGRRLTVDGGRDVPATWASGTSGSS